MVPANHASLPDGASSENQTMRFMPMWAWVIVTTVLVLAFGYLRLGLFSEKFVPLTSALALLVCLLHRNVRLLWAMAVILGAMVLYKLAMMPTEFLRAENQVLFATMQLSNTFIAAGVIHAVIKLMNKLEHTVGQLEEANTELEVSNEELAAREEEVTQQNEELQTQAEELEQQTEELNTQTEELQTLNEQILARERTLSDLLETSVSKAGEQRTLARLGATIERLFSERACAAAVIDTRGDEVVVHPVYGISSNTKQIKREQTLAGLVLRRNAVGCLADTALRPDLQTPELETRELVRSLAAAPFQAGNSMTGALEVYSTEPGEWSESELRIVQWLADQCGLLWTASRFEEERAKLLESERAARAEAQRANRMKDEFVATLSHELRTPLNAVLGWATLLKRSGCEDPAEVMRGMDVIERNARHQGQLISDLLDISRIMAGKIRLDVQPIDLSLLVESALEAVRPTADAKNVSLQRSIDPLDREVTGDPSRLEQVVWNLLSNAIKFTPKGGKVEVSVTRVASYVQIAVSDTGEGIDPEVLPHLFDRYRQADGSSTRKHGGLGLGLAIARNLVELHGGTINAQSDGHGKGSSFKVLLPVRAVEGRHELDRQPRYASVGSDVEPDAPSLEGINVLVVDDEADARDLVSHVLREHGADVELAASGAEVIELLEAAESKQLPDLLVSDIGMPEMDGYTLIGRVRSNARRRARDIPAVALTAFARSEDRTKALLAGFQAHIAKPVEAAELVATVASLRYAIPRDSGKQKNEV